MADRHNRPTVIDISDVVVTTEMLQEFQEEQLQMLDRVYGDEEIPETLKHWFD